MNLDFRLSVISLTIHEEPHHYNLHVFVTTSETQDSRPAAMGHCLSSAYRSDLDAEQ